LLILPTAKAIKALKKDADETKQPPGKAQRKSLTRISQGESPA
jgi:hypothetical protein